MIRDVEECIYDLEASLDALKREFNYVLEQYENIDDIREENENLEEINSKQFQIIEELKLENQALKKQLSALNEKNKINQTVIENLEFDLDEFKDITVNLKAQKSKLELKLKAIQECLKN